MLVGLLGILFLLSDLEKEIELLILSMSVLVEVEPILVCALGVNCFLDVDEWSRELELYITITINLHKEIKLNII